MILKLGMKHQAIEFYRVCINHDPGMTLTFLRQGQLKSPMQLNGKNRKCHLMAENLPGMSKWTEDLFMTIFWAQGVVCPCPGAIYMYMTKIFKHHLH